MFFDLISATVEQTEQIVAAEMAQEEYSLRAAIANCDAQIRDYEENIAESDRQIVGLALELQDVMEEVAEVVAETAKIPDKGAKLDRIVSKFETESNVRLDEMDAVKKSIVHVMESLDESQRAQVYASNVRVKELREAIGNREKLIHDTGYDHRQERREHLANEIAVAHTRLAELKAKETKDAHKMEVDDEPQSSAHQTKNRVKKTMRAARRTTRK